MIILKTGLLEMSSDTVNSIKLSLDYAYWQALVFQEMKMVLK
jgi:hypothetical protein